MNLCATAHADMSPREMIELIATSPPGPWADGWAGWKNTIEAHRQLVEQHIATIKPSRTVYPDKRGIVIAGGGLKYFPSVWVNVKLLRHFGCQLPIQLWYLGDSELDPYLRRLLEPLGVECVDAREFKKAQPARILCGWELKLYATLHSPFEQVLFLDADNGVVCDPSYLFDTPEFKQHGAIFWPDYACWTLKPGVWRVFGMHDMAEPEVAQHERAFESGQYLIDKARCDRELRLALWYAEHSDFTFQHVYVPAVWVDLERRYGDFGIEVDAMTTEQLWSLLAQHGIQQIDLLKLDSEGAEYLVLSELNRLGHLSHVGWIRGEWHCRASNQWIADALARTHVLNIDPNEPHTVGQFIAHRRHGS